MGRVLLASLLSALATAGPATGAVGSPGAGRTGILRLELGRGGGLGHGFRRARIVQYQPRLL